MHLKTTPIQISGSKIGSTAQMDIRQDYETASGSTTSHHPYSRLSVHVSSTALHVDPCFANPCCLRIIMLRSLFEQRSTLLSSDLDF